ncbi:MAG TPA: hypothetical protein VFW40_05850 [Capsulimonadaceae bacterium]|nr:hypothetical protein [Capsulimonadaceae bacterium]
MYIIKSGVLYDISQKAEKEFQSPFAEEFYQEDSQSWKGRSWKHQQPDNPAEAGQGGLVPRSMLWGGRGVAKPPSRPMFSAVFATPDRLYYVLEMSSSRGLFYYDFAKEQETRLFHRTDFQPHGLFIHIDHTIYTTRSNNDGSIHLSQYDPYGKREQALTSGDCRDENPFRHGSSLYYQSSGLARNAEGVIMATGNSAIQRMDVEKDVIDTVLEDKKLDYLLPRVASDGALYCIQAPHQTKPVYPVKNRVFDILLFPFRMAVAIFAFLNAFSMFFTKKPLTTAGGPNPREMDISRRILHNRAVNMQETWKKEGKKVAVSKDWKLIRYADGKTEEIASNVLWFDLDASGEPVYTDGYALYDSSGKRNFEADDLVDCVALTHSCTGATGS